MIYLFIYTVKVKYIYREAAMQYDYDNQLIGH